MQRVLSIPRMLRRQVLRGSRGTFSPFGDSVLSLCLFLFLIHAITTAGA